MPRLRCQEKEGERVFILAFFLNTAMMEFVWSAWWVNKEMLKTQL